MTMLTPYLGHAFLVSGDKDSQYSGNELSGLMIMDARGQIIYLSQQAENLLALACSPIVSRDRQKQETIVKQNLAQLCQSLDTIFQGKTANPPSWSLTNNCGRFVFHAQWLRNAHEPGGIIGMSITHQEPLTLKVLRVLPNTQLSPTQREVVLLMVQGLSNDQIGEKLHIKLTTVKDHITKIFIKLDISRREELLPKLLAMEKSEGIRLH